MKEPQGFGKELRGVRLGATPAVLILTRIQHDPNGCGEGFRMIERKDRHGVPRRVAGLRSHDGWDARHSRPSQQLFVSIPMGCSWQLWWLPSDCRGVVNAGCFSAEPGSSILGFTGVSGIPKRYAASSTGLAA